MLGRWQRRRRITHFPTVATWGKCGGGQSDHVAAKSVVVTRYCKFGGGSGGIGSGSGDDGGKGEGGGV